MKKGPPLLEPPAPTWREHAAAAGIFAAFFLLLFARTLTALRAGAEVLPGDPGGDLPNYFYYARRFFGESLRHGEFPLWNPYLMAGLPFVGTIQSATLYPWNWLHAAAPPAAWIALTLWAHMTLGAWAMWLLCRRLGATTLGALFGGLTYGASGFAAAHLYAGHVTYLCAMAWTPLVLGQFESASRNLTSRRSILGGWAFGAQILAGAPQISAMT
ncbi:MAG: hypothetical protein NTW86_23510, partial [Candidatus Sumerlaeota bacterium]|nr:hypothetical protein [Candidatus Sumerlaeota bacterium]